MSSPDMMDFETDSVQSPHSVQSPATMAAQVDSNFVMRHNVTAEAYQLFKDDVDFLFSGKVMPADQPALLHRIRSNCEGLITAFEAEKQYLMGDVLCSWATRQQKVSIGSVWTQQQHYALLTTIDTQFEYFGELLEQTLTGLTFLRDNYPNQGFSEVHGRVLHIAHYFLFYSVIVAKQPPSVVVKCGEAENHRRSRFWFNTEIRVLGGRAFGLHRVGEGLQIQCYLITDDTARILLSNAYHDVFENEEFVIEPMTAMLKMDEVNALAAKFDDMRVAKKGPLRRDSVATKRYCLCYNIRASATHGIDLIGKKVSLPFAVLVGPKTDVEAKLFLERSFADLVLKPLSEVPESVTYLEMAAALEMKFQSIIETPQKSTDTIPAIQPRMFSNQSKHHLIRRLKPDNDARILLNNFLKLPVAEEYCLKKGSTTNGEWKLVPFFEWFFKIAEFVNKHLVQMWNEGLIYGFCGKEEAEDLLKETRQTTLLIRFSDIEFGKLKVSVRDRTGAIRHHWYDTTELSTRSLARELLSNSKYYGVESIYPNINFAQALGARTPPNEPPKPRHLQPTPLYFDNQDAGMFTF
uniref:SH2 domain-containing protein n=1 Tax=Panagrellus redivivus TaxID=6233 RepID=A0A7E4ZTQ5_PANRE